jgi:hypothetical protein
MKTKTGKNELLTLSWPDSHICPTYKESFQVRWDNSISPCCHLPWSISIPLNQSECIFPQNSRVKMIMCAMLLCSIAHSIICTRLFRGKIHSDWFNGIEILQGRWQRREKVGYCYSSGLEKTLCKWDIYVPLVTKGLNNVEYFCLKR